MYPSYVFYLLRRNGLAKKYITERYKDTTYYFKYGETSGMFTINDHISINNSIQINIKFSFTLHEYIIVYEYILLSNFIHTYIKIVFFVYCNIVATDTPAGHTGFTFT